MIINIIMTIAVFTGLIFSGKNLKKIGLRGNIAIAVIAAMASGGRAIFAMIPSVQPASFLVMMCGMGFGPGAGFVCGVLVALLSSLLTSLGTWTIWQAMMWGVLGVLGYFIAEFPIWLRGLFGLMSGFLFGWIMNIWYYSEGIIPFTIETFVSACVASFTYDLAHGICNAALLLVLSQPILKLITKWLKNDPNPSKPKVQD